MNFDTKPGSLFRVFLCWENVLKLGNNFLFKNLINDINRDKPILILYDQGLFFPKFVFKLYSKVYLHPEPMNVSFIITFMCGYGIFIFYIIKIKVSNI